MHFLVVSDVFPPEPLTSARTAADIVDGLLVRGHTVQIVAPYPSRPSGEPHPVAPRRLWSRRRHGDWSILHTWSTRSTSSTLLSRGSENLSFGLTSSVALSCLAHPDAAYMNTWPLAAQLMNASVLKARSVPTLCVVKDLYPETLIGASDSILANPLRALDRAVYRRCSDVLTITDAQAATLANDREVPADRIHLVRDWLEVTPPTEDDRLRVRASLGLSDGNVAVGYVGSLTRQADLDNVLDAAGRLRAGDQQIKLFLAGAGAQHDHLARRIEVEQLGNVRLLGAVDPSHVGAVQAAMDVLLVTLRPGVATTTLPSKLISYLHSATPVVAAVDSTSETASFVNETGCGTVCGSGDPDALASTISAMALDPVGSASKGAAASEASKLFDAGLGVTRVCDLLETMAERGS